MGAPNDRGGDGGGHATRAARPLTVNAAELLRRAGAVRSVDVTVAPGVVGLDDPRLTGDVQVNVSLEAGTDRIMARGTFTVSTTDNCVRCLAPISTTLEATSLEQYTEDTPPQDPDAEDFLESFPIEHGQLDLTPMVREAVLLALADSPQCRPDCAGLCPVCGADRNEVNCGCDTGVRDERWAALDQLRDQL